MIEALKIDKFIGSQIFSDLVEKNHTKNFFLTKLRNNWAVKVYSIRFSKIAFYCYLNQFIILNIKTRVYLFNNS